MLFPIGIAQVHARLTLGEGTNETKDSCFPLGKMTTEAPYLT